MKDQTGNLREELDADELRTLLQLLAKSRRKRVSSAVIGGHRVWIKRQDAERRPLAKRLHAFMSSLLPYPFLRASREVSIKGMTDREERKMTAFFDAGFQVPHIAYRQGPVIVLTDIAPTRQDRLDMLRDLDAQAHDDVLVDCARALAQAHAAGLCHGRPHPRDFFEREGVPGFLDFEEEPEAIMPLETAQARDVWLLFFQITEQALLPDTCARALSIYREITPALVITELRKIVHFFRFTIAPLRLARRIFLGGDGKRLLHAMEFFDASLDKS